MTLRRALLLVVAVGVASRHVADAAVRRIVHFSDAHLNLSASLNASEIPSTRPRYGCDTPLSLLDSALAYASRVVASPDVLLYTGDHVNHGDGFSDEYIRKVVEKNVRMMEMYFPPDATTGRPHHVTAITGNADTNVSYAMDVTEPDVAITNAALSVVSPVWASSLSAADFDLFERRGYLQYDMDETLSILTLNTVPYSPAHYPDTSHLDDPFDQFEWLNATLHGLRRASRVAFIAGHIPPIVDSNRTQPMWHEHYIRRYQAIISDHRDIIKAQFFGHVHSIEFRAPAVEPSVTTPMPPVFTTGALSPKYGNNPSFTVWEYDAETYELLDYVVYSTDWSAAGPFEWKPLFRASTMYGISSLSTSALIQLRTRMESKTSLSRTDYYWNTKARSFHLPPCDDTACHARVLCSLTWWSTQTAYADCVHSKITGLASDLQSLLLSHVAMGVVALPLIYAIVCVVARRRLRVAHATPYASLRSPKTKLKRHCVMPLRVLSETS